VIIIQEFQGTFLPREKQFSRLLARCPLPIHTNKQNKKRKRTKNNAQLENQTSFSER
jgi:hypothetical protein